MIRITIEMIPHGDLSKIRHIATGYISNDASGNLGNGNYKVVLHRCGGSDAVWKKGEVKNFPRQKRSAWYLLHRALCSVIGD